MSRPREALPSFDEGLDFAVRSYTTSSYGTKVVKLKIVQISKDSIKIHPVNDEHFKKPYAKSKRILNGVFNFRAAL